MKKFKQFNENHEDDIDPNETVEDHMERTAGFRTNTDKEHAGVKAYMDMPKWKEDYTCYLFILRAKELHPDKQIEGSPWSIDSWIKVDYNNPSEVASAHQGMKLRAQYNSNSYLYGIWLPNEFAEMIDEDDNPDDYMDLLQKYKFKI